MAFLYQKYKNKMLTTGAPNLNAPANPIAIALVNGGGGFYSPDEVNDEFLSDIPGSAIFVVGGAGDVDLANPTVVADVFDADDKVLEQVQANGTESANYVLIYENTGVAGTSQLLALLDSTDVPGLPITPNDNDINVRWDNGPNKIFRLGDEA